MSNRAIRKAIQSLRLRISEHQDKIWRERMASTPDEEVIAHWEQEIQAFSIRLHRLENRLAVRKQRGRS